MLRIDVPVWFNAVCYMSVTVKGKTVKVLLLVFVELSTFHDRGGIPKYGLEWSWSCA